MKVAILPGDEGGCGTYRLVEPAKAVREIRPDWDIRTYAPRGEVKAHLHATKGLIEVAFPGGFWPDVIVMQRTGTPLLASIATYLQRKGVAVVADFDDAMWCISRQNVAWAAWNNQSRHRGQHWSWCDYVAERADLVTVTTDHLARRYGRHGRVEVLPNRIPDRWWIDQQTEGPGIAGWAGYLKTHPGDCDVSAPAAEVFSGLRVMGEAPENLTKIWGREPVGVDSAPLGPEYFAGLARLGTMLVGLQDNSFNRGKSTLKVLEAGAAGLPAIAAATQPHRQLAAQGFPVILASTPGEWREHAKHLSDWDGYFSQREAILEAMPAFLISAQAEAWAQSWERAAARSGFKRRTA